MWSPHRGDRACRQVYIPLYTVYFRTEYSMACSITSRDLAGCVPFASRCRWVRPRSRAISFLGGIGGSGRLPLGSGLVCQRSANKKTDSASLRHSTLVPARGLRRIERNAFIQSDQFLLKTGPSSGRNRDEEHSELPLIPK